MVEEKLTTNVHGEKMQWWNCPICGERFELNHQPFHLRRCRKPEKKMNNVARPFEQPIYVEDRDEFVLWDGDELKY